MKKLLLQNHRYIKKTGLLFIAIFLLLCNAFAGDISISLKYRIEIAMEDAEQPIVTEVSNSENFQVLGAALNLTIRDKLTLNVAYQWSTDIGTVEPLSSVTLKAPDPWIPKAGMYNIRYELSSDNDINPANDTLSYDIEVKPNLGLSFKLNQFNFISPIQQENSNTGRVDVKLPPNETNLYLNMTFAEPGNLSLAPQWLVQNFPLPAFQDTQKVSYWIDLDKIGIMNGMQIPFLNFDYTVSDTPIKEPVLSTKMYLNEVFESDYNVGGDNSVDWDPGPFQDIIPIDWNDSFKVITWNYRGCKIPDIDLDSSKYNPRDMAGEVGDWNACGPAAAVNSLQWLEDSMQNIPKTNTTLREKISIYNKLSNRQNESLE